MERKALENRGIQLETQLLLAKKTNRNKILHDKILKETANIAPVIMEMDLCTLWWTTQWIEERKADLLNTTRSNCARSRIGKNLTNYIVQNAL